MSEDTIRVASKAPMSIRITEPHPNPDRPGESAELKSAIINGGGSGETITENVDAGLFCGWMEANKYSPIVTNELFREIGKDDDLDDEIEYGFEPGLERVVKDNESAAGEGSTEGDKRASEVDMNAHSDVPNDDSPRSQTETGPTIVAPTRAPEPDLAVAPRAPADARAASDLRGGPVVNGDSPVKSTPARPATDASETKKD